MVPILFMNLLRCKDVCSLEASQTIASGAQTSLANCLTAYKASDLVRSGTTYTNTLQVTNNWQHVSPLVDFTPFPFAKKVSI